MHRPSAAQGGLPNGRELHVRHSAQTPLDRPRGDVEPLFGLQSQTKWVGTVAVGTRNIDRWRLVRQLPVPNRRWPQRVDHLPLHTSHPTPHPPIFAVLRRPWPTLNCYLMSSSTFVSTEGRPIASRTMLRSNRHQPTITSALLGIGENPIDGRDANIQTFGNLCALQAFGIKPEHVGCLGTCRVPAYGPGAVGAPLPR